MKFEWKEWIYMIIKEQENIKKSCNFFHIFINTHMEILTMHNNLETIVWSFVLFLMKTKKNK